MKSEGVGSNRKRRTDKSERLEIHGNVQAEVTRQCLELSKDYDTSAKGREDFWKAAKPLMGEITRKRMKNMMKNLEEIQMRADKAKGGVFGSTKRGYAAICKAWDTQFSNRGMRKEGGGRKWYFKAQESYLKSWHEIERMRSHAIDKTDLQEEWLDR